MATKNKRVYKNDLTIWEREEPTLRPAPAPLSRQAIVKAAIAVADADGLDAVSLRKIGASLNSSPMRLYSYVGTKAELLDLMVDAVYTEMAEEGPFEGAWREALSGIAFCIRAASQRHNWFVDLLGARPAQGPGALAFLEAAHAALLADNAFSDIDQAMKAVRAVYSYVLGAICMEIGERRAERESGMTKAEWQFTHGAYLMRAVGKGKFPTLARIIGEHVHPSPDSYFEDGLEFMLDGIAATSGADARKV